MTFSVLARDESGAIGMAVSSSSPAVAARCIHLRGAVGGVGSQNITDPRYGPLLLSKMESGATAADALAALVAKDATAAYRQILVVDSSGDTAAHSGNRTLGRHHTAFGEGVVAAGNLLADEHVPYEMVREFAASSGELETRLMAALKAGLEAGGEVGDVHSCGLAVVRDAGWNETDLRVDWSDEDPIGQLESLLDCWLPQRADYVWRGIRPESARAYGVPGDE